MAGDVKLDEPNEGIVEVKLLSTGKKGAWNERKLKQDLNGRKQDIAGCLED